MVNSSFPGQLGVLIMEGLDHCLVPSNGVSLSATSDGVLYKVTIVREVLSDQQPCSCIVSKAPKTMPTHPVILCKNVGRHAHLDYGIHH